MLVGALGALAVMTVLSVGMGWVITVVPRVYTFYASTALFAVMGIKLLREGLRMSPDEENEELEEVTQVWWRERGLFRGFVCFFVPPSDLLYGFFCRFGVWVLFSPPSYLFIFSSGAGGGRTGTARESVLRSVLCSLEPRMRGCLTSSGLLTNVSFFRDTGNAQSFCHAKTILSFLSVLGWPFRECQSFV